MATLTAGEQARMYALGKIMRGGASRGGYVSSAVYIAIDGVHVGFGATPHRVLLDTLTITDELDETPNTCGFRAQRPRACGRQRSRDHPRIQEWRSGCTPASR